MAFNRAGFRAIPGWADGFAYRDDAAPTSDYTAPGFWNAARATLAPGALIYAVGADGVVRLRVVTSDPGGVTVDAAAPPPPNTPAAILTEADAPLLTETDEPITMEA